MTLNGPLVCLCVPCYNNEVTISETLQSLVSQSYSNIIIKVFDNASTDSSLTIIEKFVFDHENVELFTLDKTIPAEENFTRCIQYSEGDYSAIYHSDDVYDSDMVKLAVEFLGKNKNCGAVATKANIINAESDKVSVTSFPKQLIEKDVLSLSRLELISLVCEYGNFVCCPSVMFKTELLKNHIKKFDNEKYFSSSDLDVWFRVAEKADFGFIDKPLINYRLSPVSCSYNMSLSRIKDSDMFIVLDAYLNEFNDDLTEKKELLLAQDRINTNKTRILLGSSGYQEISLIKILPICFKKNRMSFFLKVVIQKVLICIPYHSVFFVKFLNIK